jgi:hypothetical protein
MIEGIKTDINSEGVTKQQIPIDIDLYVGKSLDQYFRLYMKKVCRSRRVVTAAINTTSKPPRHDLYIIHKGRVPVKCQSRSELGGVFGGVSTCIRKINKISHRDRVIPSQWDINIDCSSDP